MKITLHKEGDFCRLVEKDILWYIEYIYSPEVL